MPTTPVVSLSVYVCKSATSTTPHPALATNSKTKKGSLRLAGPLWATRDRCPPAAPLAGQQSRFRGGGWVVVRGVVRESRATFSGSVYQREALYAGCEPQTVVSPPSQLEVSPCVVQEERSGWDGNKDC